MGTKLDLRDDKDILHITTSKGLLMQHEINAEQYVECSAKMQNNVAAVFEEAVKAALQNKRNTAHKKCIVM